MALIGHGPPPLLLLPHPASSLLPLTVSMPGCQHLVVAMTLSVTMP